jgi:dihydroorotate dehydrogenase (NAD+) catalytic subunit
MVDLSVRAAGLSLKNPLLAASGTFAFGREVAEYYDLAVLGGICSKGLTRDPRLGNDPPRVAETASGMLNSVGLQNPGIDAFIRDELPYMIQSGTRTIVNIAGTSIDDYTAIAHKLDQLPVDAIELNLSCPNVSTGCMLIGSDARQLGQLIREVRQVTDKPLWAKLTPNVTSISSMAAAAQEAGADAVVLINTLLGMAVDWRSRRPVLRNNTGGLSGPAIKPVALRMVSEVYQAVSIPIIGVGGIMSGEDVLEFIVAGASAVQIGTASLISPCAGVEISRQLSELLLDAGIKTLSELTGSLEYWTA